MFLKRLTISKHPVSMDCDLFNCAELVRSLNAHTHFLQLTINFGAWMSTWWKPRQKTCLFVDYREMIQIENCKRSVKRNFKHYSRKTLIYATSESWFLEPIINTIQVYHNYGIYIIITIIVFYIFSLHFNWNYKYTNG